MFFVKPLLKFLMKPVAMGCGFWAAIIVAAVLFVVASTTPLWVARVSEARLTTVDPQVVVGLVSMVLAILTLVGAAVYYLLRAQVAERVRHEIATPIDIAHYTLVSFYFYMDYSNRWRENQYSRDMETDYRFRWSVFQAVDFARDAHEKAHLFLDGEKGKDLYMDATSTLAYNLATKYMLESDERDKEEALRLVKELESGFTRDWSFQETIAWVKILCNLRGTTGYAAGVTSIRSLLSRNDSPLEWRLLQQEKYNDLFQLSLPRPT